MFTIPPFCGSFFAFETLVSKRVFLILSWVDCLAICVFLVHDE